MNSLLEVKRDEEDVSFRELPPASYVNEFIEDEGKYAKLMKGKARKHLLFLMFIPEKIFYEQMHSAKRHNNFEADLDKLEKIAMQCRLRCQDVPYR